MVAYVALFFSLAAPASAFVITGELVKDDSLTGADLREATLAFEDQVIFNEELDFAAARCPDGWKVTGGGANAWDPSTLQVTPVLYDAPNIDNGWFAEGRDPNHEVRVWAICRR